MLKIINMVASGDKTLFNLVNGTRWSLLDKLMPYCTLYGSVWFSIIISILLLLFANNELHLGTKTALGLLSSNLVVQLIKKITNRKRPFLDNPQCHTLGRLFQDYSFPSGHTCAACVLSIVLASGFPWLAQILILLAVLTGLSRIYLGQHYPTDVLAGGIIGIITGIVTIRLF